MTHRGLRRAALDALLPIALTGTVACSTGPGVAPAAAVAPPSGAEPISRTANGIAHIVVADPDMPAYDVACAHAQDNACRVPRACDRRRPAGEFVKPTRRRTSGAAVHS